MRWRLTIEAWPHATGSGQAADQKAAGERIIYFYVDAEDIQEAFKMARCYSEGVAANPAVWKAPIMGVHRHEYEVVAAETGLRPATQQPVTIEVPYRAAQAG